MHTAQAVSTGLEREWLVQEGAARGGDLGRAPAWHLARSLSNPPRQLAVDVTLDLHLVGLCLFEVLDQVLFQALGRKLALHKLEHLLPPG